MHCIQINRSATNITNKDLKSFGLAPQDISRLTNKIDIKSFMLYQSNNRAS